MSWPRYCHSALDAESRSFSSSLVPRFRGDDVWISAGVYLREGGDGNDALGKLRRKRTHLLCQLIYVAHGNKASRVFLTREGLLLYKRFQFNEKGEISNECREV
jgi:hypothetical protein